MEKLIFLILILFPSILIGQLYFEKGDSLTILAKSGLTLRDSSTTQSSKIASIPFREKVLVVERTHNYKRIDSRTGYWVKVNYHDKEGYLFSGYLTDLEIPILKEEEIDCFRYQHFLQLILLNSDSLVYSGKREIKHFGKGGRIINFNVYRDGTIIRYENGYEYEDVIIESFNVRMNDIINLLEYYISKMSKCENKNNPIEDYRVLIDKDRNGNIQKIECSRLRFFVEKRHNKIIIVSNIWDL